MIFETNLLGSITIPASLVGFMEYRAVKDPKRRLKEEFLMAYVVKCRYSTPHLFFMHIFVHISGFFQAYLHTCFSHFPYITILTLMMMLWTPRPPMLPRTRLRRPLLTSPVRFLWSLQSLAWSLQHQLRVLPHPTHHPQRKSMSQTPSVDYHSTCTNPMEERRAPFSTNDALFQYNSSNQHKYVTNILM